MDVTDTHTHTNVSTNYTQVHCFMYVKLYFTDRKNIIHSVLTFPFFPLAGFSSFTGSGGSIFLLSSADAFLIVRTSAAF